VIGLRMASSTQPLPESDDLPAHCAIASDTEIVTNGRAAVAPRPAANDLLSAIQAMSEEEKIALFS
jgi:hypothetical protein